MASEPSSRPLFLESMRTPNSTCRDSAVYNLEPIASALCSRRDQPALPCRPGSRASPRTASRRFGHPASIPNASGNSSEWIPRASAPPASRNATLNRPQPEQSSRPCSIPFDQAGVDRHPQRGATRRAFRAALLWPNLRDSASNGGGSRCGPVAAQTSFSSR